MRTKDLVDAISAASGLKPMEADNALASLVEQLSDALADGNSVSLPGFGKFEVRTRAARTGRNPATGEELNIPEKKTVAFKAGKALKDAVNS